MNDDRRSPLQIRALIQELSDGETSVGVVVMVVGLIMMREKIMIQKDRIVVPFREEFLRLIHGLRDVEFVSGKSFFEPSMPPSIVIQKENADRSPLGTDVSETHFHQNIS
jgi:hypothetical protein